MKDIPRVLRMIRDNMKGDMALLDGQPFNGKTVAKQFGHQAAAISALAKVLILIMEKIDEPT